jgi:hypothetical protein
MGSGEAAASLLYIREKTHQYEECRGDRPVAPTQRSTNAAKLGARSI